LITQADIEHFSELEVILGNPFETLAPHRDFSECIEVVPPASAANSRKAAVNALLGADQAVGETFSP
jgi:hypothetical protein